eukprot:COSAG06_NODE_690_length_13054_cov_5.226476_3_plen_87_part_00
MRHSCHWAELWTRRAERNGHSTSHTISRYSKKTQIKIEYGTDTDRHDVMTWHGVIRPGTAWYGTRLSFPKLFGPTDNLTQYVYLKH